MRAAFDEVAAAAVAAGSVSRLRGVAEQARRKIQRERRLADARRPADDDGVGRRPGDHRLDRGHGRRVAAGQQARHRGIRRARPSCVLCVASAGRARIHPRPAPPTQPPAPRRRRPLSVSCVASARRSRRRPVPPPRRPRPSPAAFGSSGASEPTPRRSRRSPVPRHRSRRPRQPRPPCGGSSAASVPLRPGHPMPLLRSRLPRVRRPGSRRVGGPFAAEPPSGTGRAGPEASPRAPPAPRSMAHWIAGRMNAPAGPAARAAAGGHTLTGPVVRRHHRPPPPPPPRTVRSRSLTSG